MAGKRTLNAKNLQPLGAAALAELLIEVSAGNAQIQRRLRLALAAAGGAEDAAQEVRKRLATIARSPPSLIPPNARPCLRIWRPSNRRSPVRSPRPSRPWHRNCKCDCWSCQRVCSTAVPTPRAP
jgi:hypothetical protein